MMWEIDVCMNFRLDGDLFWSVWSFQCGSIHLLFWWAELCSGEIPFVIFYVEKESINIHSSQNFFEFRKVINPTQGATLKAINQ